MSHNLEYLLSRPGALKLATIIFGIVASILCSHSYGQSPYTDFYEGQIRPSNSTWPLPGTELELANMTGTFIILGISLVSLTAHSLLYTVVESRLNKFIDVAFHLLAALTLFSGGIALIYSAIRIENSGCTTFRIISNRPSPNHHFLELPSFISSSLHTIFHSSNFIAKTPNTLSKDATTELCHYFGEKIVGGSFNMLNAVVYGLLAVVIQGTDLEDL